MPKRFHDTCPVCNALMAYELPGNVVCPHCSSNLLVGNSDPTFHDLNEIDPDIDGGALGEFHLNLHPEGTQVCVVCQHVFPSTFECCPKLVDLAVTSYRQKTQSHGPRTDDRIAQFLYQNERVVSNTVRLRALEFQHGQLEKETFDIIQSTLEQLDMQSLIDLES